MKWIMGALLVGCLSSAVYAGVLMSFGINVPWHGTKEASLLLIQQIVEEDGAEVQMTQEGRMQARWLNGALMTVSVAPNKQLLLGCFTPDFQSDAKAMCLPYAEEYKRRSAR